MICDGSACGSQDPAAGHRGAHRAAGRGGRALGEAAAEDGPVPQVRAARLGTGLGSGPGVCRVWPRPAVVISPV